MESHIPAWSESEAWRVSKRPELRIGARDGAEEFTFGNLRAVGRFADGRIFVGDEQAHTIRVYSPEGVYLGSAGREGDGPGDLRWFQTVSDYRGDSVWVYDQYGQDAVTVFGPDLVFSRKFRNPVPEGNYWVWASLSDGRFLLSTPGGSRREPPGIAVDSSFVIVASADGLSTDTIGSFEVRRRRGNANGDIPNSQSRELFLFPQGLMTGRGDRVLWAEGREFEYIEADPEGRIRRIVRKEHDPIPVTDEVMEVPVHEWEVFDPRGVWLGTVETPVDLEVGDIGIDRITGIVTDEFDVQYVQVHELDRR